MEETAVMMVGLNWQRIHEGLKMLATQKRGDARTLRLVKDYATSNVSEKVVRLIISYTDYVNRVVWHKETQERRFKPMRILILTQWYPPEPATL